ncbi:hypothetical protein CBM2608_B60065 [Cupriavidus taiwanensis]|nr:hypothetical protein CBM2608_B60065 [Cupriavidus taiwanensis]
MPARAGCSSSLATPMRVGPAGWCGATAKGAETIWPEGWWQLACTRPADGRNPHEGLVIAPRNVMVPVCAAALPIAAVNSSVAAASRATMAAAFLLRSSDMSDLTIVGAAPTRAAIVIAYRAGPPVRAWAAFSIVTASEHFWDFRQFGGD